MDTKKLPGKRLRELRKKKNINQEKLAELINVDPTTISNIENGYDINREMEKFKWADTVIFQSPMNWFSVPWIFKKYIDEIYQYGTFYKGSKEYGRGGLMSDKRYMFSVTCNSTEEDFNNINSFFNGNSEEDILTPLHLLHKYCGMTPIKSFFCHDAVHNPDIPLYLKNLEEHLNKYVFICG
ncbi:MAG: NAD(P)H-dependent oxidoreductase [Candidatus Avigastranaerophilus sp.]